MTIPAHTFQARFAVALISLSSPACNLDLPPGCGDVLVPRADEAVCLNEARCEQLEDDPNYVARWVLFVDEDAQGTSGEEPAYSNTALSKRRNCVADYLDNRGITLIDRGMEGDDSVVAEGIEANFEAILSFDVVRAYDLQCNGEVCEYCVDLDSEACMADAFCDAMICEGS